MDLGIIGILIACFGGGILGMFLLGKVGGKFDLIKKLKDKFMDRKQEELEEIRKKQNKVRLDIEVNEKVDKETRDKIEERVKKAEEEISEIAKEKNIGKIHKSITSDWGDI